MSYIVHPAKSQTFSVQDYMLQKLLVVCSACLPHRRHRRDQLPGHRMFGIGRCYSMSKHPFIISFERIVCPLYRTGGRPHDGILQSAVDRPRQPQYRRLGPAPFVLPTRGPDQSDTTVFVQLRSILEPPGRIEIGKDRRGSNQTDAWKRAPRPNDGIFAGIRAELLLGQLNLLLGGIVANPKHLQLSLQDRIVQP